MPETVTARAPRRKKKDLAELIQQARADQEKRPQTDGYMDVIRDVGAPGREGIEAARQLERHERVAHAITLGFRDLARRSMEVAQACYEFVSEDLWARCGHATPEDWFETHGISYRTVRGLLAIYRAILAIPEPDRPALTEALGDLGVHKSRVIAPVLTHLADEFSQADPGGAPPPAVPWKDWVDQAKVLSREALQERASEALGLKPRRMPNTGGAEGDAFAAYLVRHMPDAETQAEVTEFLRLGYALAGTRHSVAVVLAAVREVLPAWREQVKRIHAGQGNL